MVQVTINTGYWSIYMHTKYTTAVEVQHTTVDVIRVTIWTINAVLDCFLDTDSAILSCDAFKERYNFMYTVTINTIAPMCDPTVRYVITFDTIIDLLKSTNGKHSGIGNVLSLKV